MIVVGRACGGALRDARDVTYRGELSRGQLRMWCGRKPANMLRAASAAGARGGGRPHPKSSENVESAGGGSNKGLRVAKKHARPSILSAAVLALTDGSTAGGWGFAVGAFRKASGMKFEDATYSMSLGLLPMSLLYAAVRFDDEGSARAGIGDAYGGGRRPSGWVDWPGAAAFASSLISARTVPGMVVGSPGDVSLHPSHPLVRTASGALFSIVVVGVGCASLRRSHEGYKRLGSGDDGGEDDEKRTAHGIDDDSEEEKGGPPSAIPHARGKMAERVRTQFRETRERWAERSGRVQSFAIAGGTTGLGMFLLGPSALSVPVPLLQYLTAHDGVGGASGGGASGGGLSPRGAFDSFVVGTIPYLLFNIMRMHWFGARPSLSLFVPFAACIGAMYGFAEKFVLPNTPDYVVDGTFGLLALGGGGLKFVGSIRGMKKLL